VTSRWFLDTNVLVYLFDVHEPAKRSIAQNLIGSQDPARFAVSAQVLGEFYVTVTRKLRHPLDAPTARTAVSQLAQLPVIATDLPLVRAAMETAEKARLSYWDALIVEAAASSGCDRLLTEDMTAGETIRGVQIVNPFA
jgi:predicted nucleic acid-binding protein